MTGTSPAMEQWVMIRAQLGMNRMHGHGNITFHKVSANICLPMSLSCNSAMSAGKR
jgi:hypothetical protein